MRSNLITKADKARKYLFYRIYFGSCLPLENLYILQLCYTIHVGKCMIFLFVWERIKLNNDNSLEI